MGADGTEAAERLQDMGIGLAPKSSTSLRDAVKIGAEAAADAADTEAAIAFVEKGPQALEDLQVGSEPENFTSFDAFKKSELEK